MLAEVETVVKPAQVPFDKAIFKFETFATGVFAVRTTSAPETDAAS